MEIEHIFSKAIASLILVGAYFFFKYGGIFISKFNKVFFEKFNPNFAKQATGFGNLYRVFAHGFGILCLILIPLIWLGIIKLPI